MKRAFISAYIACCLAGLGLIQIPAYDVKGHLEAGELVEVMAGYRAAPMPMMLLYPHRQHLSRRLQVFADWLEQLLIREVLSEGGSAKWAPLKSADGGPNFHPSGVDCFALRR